MAKNDWTHLNQAQVGRYAEYLVKMECTLNGLDVYTSEVDDKGIDFVIRRDVDRYYDVQVKAIRGWNYVFLAKAVFSPRPGLLAALVILLSGERPRLYLIPSTAWNELDALLVSRDYVGQKSKPEWGLNLSAKNAPLLERFAFETVAASL